MQNRSKEAVAKMIANGWSQAQIAYAYGLKSRGTMNNWIKENLPTLTAKFNDTPAQERAKSWLTERKMELEKDCPPEKVLKRHTVHKKHKYKFDLSGHCQYFKAKQREYCGEPCIGNYCDDCLPRTMPRSTVQILEPNHKL